MQQPNPINAETNGRAMDARLAPLLRAASDSERDRELTILLAEQAEPVARQIIRQKLRGESNAEDIWQEVTLQLLIRLGEAQSAPEEKSIENFRSYAAVTTYRVCADFLRRKYPLRFSLRNKIRYLLTHDAQFDLWETGAENFAGGLRGWQFRFKKPEKNEKYQALLENALSRAHEIFPQRNFAVLPLPQLARAIFDFVQTPVELDDLTAIVAELQGIKDQSATRENREDEDTQEKEIAAIEPSVLDDITGREFLANLWREIQELPARQRAALLLNLRDGSGGNALENFLLASAATPRQLADALEMSEAEFARLWRDLPLDDLRIAEILGATRQQVINLRKCAREKLGRRLRE